MCQVAKPIFKITQIIFLVKRVKWQNFESKQISFLVRLVYQQNRDLKLILLKFQFFRKNFKNSLPPWFYKNIFISKIINFNFTYFCKIK